MGTGYTTVVFAAIVTYLGPKFEQLRETPTQTDQTLAEIDKRTKAIEEQLRKLTDRS